MRQGQLVAACPQAGNRGGEEDSVGEMLMAVCCSRKG